MRRPDSNDWQASLDLIRAGLITHGRLALTVVGDSMAPALQPGDRVWVTPADPRLLCRGDVVVYERAGPLIIHRLIKRQGQFWIAKGDNRRQPDPPVPPAAILGQVIAVERPGRRVDLTGRRQQIIQRFRGWAGWWEAHFNERGRRFLRLLSDLKE